MVDDDESHAHLCFDFKKADTAMNFADEAFKSCDLYKVWVEILEDECTTTQSPMWRYTQEHE